MKVVGYVTSDALRSGFVSHQIQNSSIRSYLELRGHDYLLSWTEYKGRAPFVLLSLLEKDFYDGISFYSVEQLAALENPRSWLKRLSESNRWMGFAREGLALQGRVGTDEIERLVWLKKNLEGSRDDLQLLGQASR